MTQTYLSRNYKWWILITQKYVSIRKPKRNVLIIKNKKKSRIRIEPLTDFGLVWNRRTPNQLGSDSGPESNPPGAQPTPCFIQSHRADEEKPSRFLTSKDAKPGGPAWRRAAAPLHPRERGVAAAARTATGRREEGPATCVALRSRRYKLVSFWLDWKHDEVFCRRTMPPSLRTSRMMTETTKTAMMMMMMKMMATPKVNSTFHSITSFVLIYFCFGWPWFSCTRLGLF